MIRHLAIFEGEAIDKIFSGEKTIDGRFSQIKLPPFAVVSRSDLIYMKRSGGEIEGQFLVDRVIFFDHPKKEEAEFLKKKYQKELAMEDSFWYQHTKVNYLTLMFISLPQKLTISPKFAKKDLRGWVVLGPLNGKIER